MNVTTYCSPVQEQKLLKPGPVLCISVFWRNETKQSNIYCTQLTVQKCELLSLLSELIGIALHFKLIFHIIHHYLLKQDTQNKQQNNNPHNNKDYKQHQTTILEPLIDASNIKKKPIQSLTTKILHATRLKILIVLYQIPCMRGTIACQKFIFWRYQTWHDN